jgi:hypothetical protein
LDFYDRGAGAGVEVSAQLNGWVVRNIGGDRLTGNLDINCYAYVIGSSVRVANAT